jgi:pimeloyl-ACP methyl ester carboxylesterase
MAGWLNPETFDVPVDGGDLWVARWGDSGPVVLALHGITASHMTWPWIARELQGDMQVIAPDLRGRGGSRDLPGPFGMKTHAGDCLAVLDHHAVDKAVVVGHSMGGFVAAVLALHHPERISHLILMDGGLVLGELPPDADVDQLMTVMLGPAVQRLSMKFDSLESYYDFWRAHPSVQDEGAWNEVFEAYLAYDLMGEPPELYSKTRTEAVFEDGRDSFTSDDLKRFLDAYDGSITLLRAPRGLLNETPGLYSNDLVKDLKATHPNLRDILIEDVNHYTLSTSERGAKLVSEEIRAVLAPQEA